eukprot:3772217-Amphidinium_carterae.2
MEGESGAAASTDVVVTPDKPKRGAVASLHSVAPAIKRPRNRPDLSVEEQVTQAISDNLAHYNALQLDSYLVEGERERQIKWTQCVNVCKICGERERRFERQYYGFGDSSMWLLDKDEGRNGQVLALVRRFTVSELCCIVEGLTCREHIRNEKEACRKEGRSTGKLFWQKLKAMFDAVNESEEVLAIAAGVDMPEPVWSHFKQAVFRHERGPLTTWCRMQTSSPTEEEGKVVCMALIRLNAKNEACFHAGLQLLQYMHRVDFKTEYPQLFEAIRPRADYWLLEVLIETC